MFLASTQHLESSLTLKQSRSHRFIFRKNDKRSLARKVFCQVNCISEQCVSPIANCLKYQIKARGKCSLNSASLARLFADSSFSGSLLKVCSAVKLPRNICTAACTVAAQYSRQQERHCCWCIVFAVGHLYLYNFRENVSYVAMSLNNTLKLG